MTTILLWAPPAPCPIWILLYHSPPWAVKVFDGGKSMLSVLTFLTHLLSVWCEVSVSILLLSKRSLKTSVAAPSGLFLWPFCSMEHWWKPPPFLLRLLISALPLLLFRSLYWLFFGSLLKCGWAPRWLFKAPTITLMDDSHIDNFPQLLSLSAFLCDSSLD